MPTENHDFPTDFEGSYPETFAAIIEELDRKVLLAGTLDERPPAPETPTGVWFLDHEGEENEDAEAVLYARRHTGEWAIVDLEIATDLSTVPQTGDHFTVTATWSGAEDGAVWQADITGHATTAAEVEHADSASLADVIGGLSADAFAVADLETTVSGRWRYTATQEFADGLTANGPVGLPGYTDT